MMTYGDLYRAAVLEADKLEQAAKKLRPAEHAVLYALARRAFIEAAAVVFQSRPGAVSQPLDFINGRAKLSAFWHRIEQKKAEIPKLLNDWPPDPDGVIIASLRPYGCALSAALAFARATYLGTLQSMVKNVGFESDLAPLELSDPRVASWAAEAFVELFTQTIPAPEKPWEVNQQQYVLLKKLDQEWTSLSSRQEVNKKTAGITPRWDRGAKRLTYDGKLVKSFRQVAKNQFLVLDSFEELKWPKCIDNPLPGSDDPIKRLNDTVSSLNKGQTKFRVRFSANGSGTGFCWAINENRVAPGRTGTRAGRVVRSGAHFLVKLACS